ncbi:hypothetical protein RN001_004916 [Aquatica leii]|uniref:Alpha/beta hydrolase fold-3 domain-containing protein n=1 Tax=Aquatica leii TaxID=1421715 RepID=A0AAN7SHN8_9COLE|nr:hypothetical protein RN001_004916 [Aquatica leii]
MNRTDEVELLFSPSRWSRRYRAEDIVQKHIEFITRASYLARKRVPCQLNIPYGPAEREQLDMFGTNLPPESPILIYIHGGDYWQELGKEVSSYIVEPLYKNDFKVIIFGYTLCPQITLAQVQDQINRAFVKCVEYAKNTGSKSLYLCGHSGGAQLVASLFQTCFNSIPEELSDILKGVFLLSGIYDLIPLTKTRANDALQLDSSTARKLSPLYQPFVASQDILFFIIVGENESPAFVEQSESFYRKLKGLGYKSELIVVKEVDHFDIAEQLNEENYEIINCAYLTIN